jgi:hypothetical protein
VLLLLLFLQMSPLADSDSGSIWVRTEPGVVVYLNSVRVGVSNVEQGGLWMHGLKPGIHEVRVEVPGGGSATINVEVEIGQAVKVPVSSLGIRANDVRRKGELEIRPAAPRSGCFVKLGDRRRALGSTAVIFEDLVGGKQRVSVTCGARTSQQDIEVPAGRSILVSADLSSGAMKIIADRPLRTLVDIKTTRDDIMNAPISAIAKRLLMATVDSNIVILNLTDTRGKIALLAEAPSANAASNLIERIKRRPEVEEIKVEEMTMKANRAVLKFSFTVR